MIRIRLKIKHKNSHFHKIVLINFFGDEGSIYWWLFDFINGYTNTIKSIRVNKSNSFRYHVIVGVLKSRAMWNENVRTL